MIAPRSSVYRVVGIALLLASALVALTLALISVGTVDPLTLRDPVVRWGLPVAKLLSNIGVAAMLGSLVLALFALRPGTKVFERALDVASVGAAFFTLTSGVAAFLTFTSMRAAASQAADPTTAGQDTGEQFGNFLLGTALGQAWLITTLLGAVITVLAFAWRTWTPVLLTAVLAAASFVPLAMQGYSGATEGYDIAADSILLHTIGAAVWLGSLLLVVLAHRMPDADEPSLVRRYSSLALAAFVVVAFSGIARSSVALGGWEELGAPYGGILIAKTVLLVALGGLSVWYRMRLIPRLGVGGGSARWFWMLVLADLTLMGLASGSSVALAGIEPSADEVGSTEPTPAQLLTGSPLPPELTLDRWFTQWSVDVLWLIAVCFGLVFYLVCVLRLGRRGDRWPVHRTILWTLGMLLLLWVTSGPLNAYQDYLISVHLLARMLLMMVIALLLVCGTPVTLALRAIHRRDDDTRGGREWILSAVRSPFARVVTQPLVAAGLFLGSMWGFFYTDLFRWSMYDHLGRESMIVLLLIIGSLFMTSLIGLDPVPFRLSYRRRLIVLVVVAVTQAIFGFSIVMQQGLILAEWFGAMGRTWGPTPLDDQDAAASVVWSIGGIVTVIIAVVIAMQSRGRAGDDGRAGDNGCAGDNGRADDSGRAGDNGRAGDDGRDDRADNAEPFSQEGRVFRL